MPRPDRRDPNLESRWRDRIARWKRSGQTIRDFCAAHGLGENNFYAWRRAIAHRDRERTTATPTTPSTAFVPVRVTLPTVLEVVLASGLIVRVPVGADPAVVAQLVAALGAKSC